MTPEGHYPTLNEEARAPTSRPVERVALVLSSLASEYRLAISYALEVISEIEAVLEAEDKPVLRALVSSMKSDLEAHVTLAVLLEEAARTEAGSGHASRSIALPEPPEETTEPLPEEVGLYAEQI